MFPDIVDLRLSEFRDGAGDGLELSSRDADVYSETVTTNSSRSFGRSLNDKNTHKTYKTNPSLISAETGNIFVWSLTQGTASV
jgi:hypothetical protein